MRKLIYTLLMFVLFLSQTVISQVTLEWTATYNPPQGPPYTNSSTVKSIAIDAAGNAHVTGYSFMIYPNPYIEFYRGITIKYNSSGSQLWLATGDNYQPSSIALNFAGNVYVTGPGGIKKYNSSGAVQWGIAAPASGGLFSIAVDGSSNVYVTCGGSDYTAAKYNSLGVQQWIQNYNGPGNAEDIVSSSILDSSGNVYITGKSKGSGTDFDYATIKYNANGVQQWVARYNGPSNGSDEASKIALDGLGNVYVTGVSFDNGSNKDYVTIKYNSAGVQQWVARYDGPGNDVDAAKSIAVDASGIVYVTGTSTGIGTGLDYCTIKYNSNGVQQWIQRYGTANGDETPSSMATDEYNNVYVTGNGGTVKYSPAGAQKWINTQAGESIIMYGASNLFIIGPGFVTKKYSQQVGINPISEVVPLSYSLSQNYPNPFNPTTKVKFDVVRLGNVKIVVYDIMGREVQTLVNESLKPGTYETTFDGSNFTSGIYFYRLTIHHGGSSTNNIQIARKCILLK